MTRRLPVPRMSGRWVLAALVVLFVLTPFIEAIPKGDLFEAIAITLVLSTAVHAAAQGRAVMVMLLVLAIPAVVARWLNYFRPELIPPEVFLGAAVLAMGFITLRFLLYVMRAREVTTDVLCIGISAFLMVALLWAICYLLVDRAVPKSFLYTAGPPTDGTMNGFVALYFSLVTLCTVGFGDIVPVSTAARTLAMFEGAVGVVFIAVMLARLVSMYSSGGTNGKEGAGI